MPEAVEHCDLLVVGSGLGGLATAITAATSGLRVIIAEKEPLFGGTTARSGGFMWVPCSGPAKRAGVVDNLIDARRYLEAETGNFFDAARVDAFLNTGAEAVEFFETQTELRFEPALALPDYHAETPGGREGGRPLGAQSYDGRALGREIRRLRPPLREITIAGMMIGSSKDLPHFPNVLRSPRSFVYVAKLMVRYGYDLLRHGRSMRLTNGNALVARLARTAFDLKIQLWTSAPVTELLWQDDRIAGAVVQRDGQTVTVRPRHGVVLATGGFPQNRDLRACLFPHAPTGAEHWSPAPEGNTGDGIALGESVGGHLVSDLPHAAAWVPVSLVPQADGRLNPFPHFVDRGKPGMIAVTPEGRRFVNEGRSYHDFCQGMLAACAHKAETFAWLVCDHSTIRRYGLGFAKPYPLPIAHLVRSGYLHKGQTLGDLARQTGMDEHVLAATVDRVNADAATGVDTEFGRGTMAYNRYLGDPAVRPNPAFGAVASGPFYAVKLVMGDLGTFAGLRTDAQARVLDQHNAPVPGLFAVGNDALSIMGGNYPGGGITLGPALVFGFIAGRTIATGALDNRQSSPPMR